MHSLLHTLDEVHPQLEPRSRCTRWSSWPALKLGTKMDVALELEHERELAAGGTGMLPGRAPGPPNSIALVDIIF